MFDDERPSRVWLRTWFRFLLGGLLLAVLSGVATWTFAQNTLSTLAADIFPAKNRITGTKGLIVAGYEGSPQTFLLIGSDKRVGSKNAEEREAPPRSDTLLLVRLDPQQGQTSVLSIPRDLLVHIEPSPGQVYYPEKINAAYTLGSEHGGKDGGAKLAAATIEQLLKIKLNGIVDVTFKGFIDVVDSLGCVYVNVDHRYWHTSGAEPSEDYSSIHLASGYQRLCYENALSYVRYRHLDSDFVRVARQQDFIRQLREQVSAGDLLGQIEKVSKAVGRAVITTFASTPEELLRLTKLIVFSQRKPLRQVKFRFSSDSTFIEGADYVTATPEEISRTVREFLSPGGSGANLEGARPARPASTPARPGGGRRRSASPPPPSAVGLYPASASLREEALKAAIQLPFPVVVPELQTGPAIPQEAHAYRLRDRGGKRHHGFIEVFQQNQIGGYYDVEGMDWTDPPLIANATQTENIGHRHYILVDDGSHIHVIAWREHGDLYWVNNTLLEELSNSQMIYIAQSARPLR